ncbi:P-loop NTPase fold protein [Clostridium fallax]|uniref:KAP family P-loop domain-containing protein n=1 Tax=Clostridium fallax TaxID=1533 RepID=A0A1M4YEU6_9CLOT|nr:P-loop NTPase fold protein [Clostridium fallax]SHF04249.1 KAP family P-loop domain-containing protein [Clostridium fallax]SQB22317.1 Predicted P-loop ATPase [Clostridium fallax]
MDKKLYNLNLSDIEDIVQGIKLLNNNTATIIGIQGINGGGKTSIVKEVEKILKKDKKLRIEYLNIFYMKDENEFINQLFIKLNNLINDELLIKYEKSSSIFAKETYEYKNILNEKLRIKNEKLVLIIDDLDRGESKSIRNILSIIKNKYDFDNVIYLLCYDSDILSSNLGMCFGKNGEKIAREYINKVVDIEVTIKNSNKNDLLEYLIKESEKIIQKKGFKISKDLFKGIKELFSEFFKDKLTNIRIVNKFLNTIDFKIFIEENKIENFLIVEGLKIFYPNVYRKIDIEDKYINEYVIRNAIEQFENQGDVGSFSDTALLIEKTVETLICEREKI